tara:strand:- start:5989 stop:6201 length:213 start_codon:yes stop_codon:yes gene_type:complete
MPNERDSKRYGGIVDGLVDSLLEKYGVSKELVEKITKIINGVVDNVSVQQIGDETFITVHLNDINFKFKK